jgi:hypothetical protein
MRSLFMRLEKRVQKLDGQGTSGMAQTEEEEESSKEPESFGMKVNIEVERRMEAEDLIRTRDFEEEIERRVVQRVDDEMKKRDAADIVRRVDDEMKNRDAAEIARRLDPEVEKRIFAKLDKKFDPETREDFDALMKKRVDAEAAQSYAELKESFEAEVENEVQRRLTSKEDDLMMG